MISIHESMGPDRETLFMSSRIIILSIYMGGVRALTIETIVALPAVNVPPQ